MAKRKLRNVLGLAGVAPEEDPRAVRVAHWFEIPMLLVAVWIVIEWYASATGDSPWQWALWTDWFIWLFFVAETTLLTVLVRDKWLYLRSNWINALIILMGIPVLWGNTLAGALRALRLLLMLALVVHVSDMVKAVLSRNRMGTTLFIALIVILLSGLVITAIDPGIVSVWDGVWWAWVTVTTVGYGDVVPTSGAGKFFAALLILLGLGLLAMMTANFSAYFIARDEKKNEEQGHKITAQLDEIQMQLKQIKARLDKLDPDR